MKSKKWVPVFLEIRSREEVKTFSKKLGIKIKLPSQLAVILRGLKKETRTEIENISRRKNFEFECNRRTGIILTDWYKLKSIGEEIKQIDNEIGEWLIKGSEEYPPPLKVGNKKFDFREKIYVMGVINVTPDSFFSGSRVREPQEAVEVALRMKEEGADIIDIGGESTRPGASPISVKEEIERVIPVLKAIKKKVKVPVSVDTYKADVAEVAVKEGADMINDISGLTFDKKMVNVVKRYGVPVVLMHTSGPPQVMQKRTHYRFLFSDIINYLLKGLEKLGKEFYEKTILDPGIGFGKLPFHNLAILDHLEILRPFNRPVLVGVSRKSFIGFFKGGETPEDRLEGTISSITLSVLRGAHIVRVHDVKSVRKALNLLEGLKRLWKEASQW